MTNTKQKISLVIPCYNEEDTVKLFYDTVEKELKPIKSKYSLEYVFVDDGSKDKTLENLIALKGKKRNIHIISFSRNFGKEAALLAGLENSNGDYTAVMDVDLQDPPSLLLKMIEEIEKGEYEVIGCRRVDRIGEPEIRSWFANKFYKLINMFTEVEIVDGVRDFRLMRKEVVESVIKLQERNRFSKGLFPWVGYKTKYLEYKNVERAAGVTHWNFRQLLFYAINGIVAFTSAPLHLAIILGLFIAAIGVVFMLFIIAKAILIGDPVGGYPSLITIITLLGGTQLICIGVLGEYLAKVYNETKNRPNYIIRKIY